MGRDDRLARLVADGGEEVWATGTGIPALPAGWPTSWPTGRPDVELASIDRLYRGA